MSAWIETPDAKLKQEQAEVALLVSAWIETKKVAFTAKVGECRTPRECVD